MLEQIVVAAILQLEIEQFIADEVPIHMATLNVSKQRPGSLRRSIKMRVWLQMANSWQLHLPDSQGI